MVRIVEVVPYRPEWKNQAQEEAARVTKAMGSNILAVHHIGSTAIPGIKAKPIIDLMVEVRDILEVDRANATMIGLGYEPRGEYGIPGRRYFVRREGERDTHHVHMYQQAHPEIVRHLNFQEYMVAHPQDAQAYSRLKEQLAQSFRYDPDNYTDSKTGFIRGIDQKALKWKQGISNH